MKPQVFLPAVARNARHKLVSDFRVWLAAQMEYLGEEVVLRETEFTIRREDKNPLNQSWGFFDSKLGDVPPEVIQKRAASFVDRPGNGSVLPNFKLSPVSGHFQSRQNGRKTGHFQGCGPGKVESHDTNGFNLALVAALDAKNLPEQESACQFVRPLFCHLPTHGFSGVFPGDPSGIVQSLKGRTGKFLCVHRLDTIKPLAPVNGGAL